MSPALRRTVPWLVPLMLVLAGGSVLVIWVALALYLAAVLVWSIASMRWMKARAGCR